MELCCSQMLHLNLLDVDVSIIYNVNFNLMHNSSNNSPDVLAESHDLDMTWHEKLHVLAHKSEGLTILYESSTYFGWYDITTSCVCTQSLGTTRLEIHYCVTAIRKWTRSVIKWIRSVALFFLFLFFWSELSSRTSKKLSQSITWYNKYFSGRWGIPVNGNTLTHFMTLVVFLLLSLGSGWGSSMSNKSNSSLCVQT